MALDTSSKSRTLSGITDLTLLAPVKPGLIQAMDSVSHATRARLVLRTLNNLRLSSREVEPTPLIQDLVDRVRTIHSFRVVLIDREPRQILLNVVFDGGWEPYLRRIWRDLGPLLDLVFCNCEGYRLSSSSSFADYAAWVRSVQVETDFFYTAAPVTVADLHYLREQERQRIDGSPPPAGPAETPDAWLTQVLPALVALYRLSDLHPHDPRHPENGDGGCLWRAGQRLLAYLPRQLGNQAFIDHARQQAELTPEQGGRPLSPSERAALRWFTAASDLHRKASPAPTSWNPQAIQGGIIEPYPDITHGALLLIGLQDAGAARRLLEHLRQRIEPASRQDASVHHNLAFTWEGLRRLGVPDGQLAQLPAEFREGMARRAGILGDVGVNHPLNWTLPEANVSPDGQATGPGSANPPVDLSRVHAVLLLQRSAGGRSDRWIDPAHADHPLRSAIGDLHRHLADHRGHHRVTILSVQGLQRYSQPDGRTREAFGFVDGISQPHLGKPRSRDDQDLVKTGDLLLGHPSTLDDKPALRGPLWDDGSFLVVRKLRQDVDAFRHAVQDDAQRKAALMGRTVDGAVSIGQGQTVQPGDPQGFDFGADPEGRHCPLASHIRRANPRTPRMPDLQTIPRILRRGMSWGPRDGGPCGLMFMAYNASIAEQFEVIQGWLAGGNSAGPGLYSGVRDPLLGVPLPGDPASFPVPGGAIPLGASRPFARLEWGLYLFVPSMAALDRLHDIADDVARLDRTQAGTGERDEADRRRAQERAAVATQGAAIIQQLRLAERRLALDVVRDQWKTVLEDPGARARRLSEAVWAAIAEVHGGALRTPYGVLVGSATLVGQVLADSRRTTATGYNERLARSFGEIYLGMDDTGQAGCDYRRLSTPVNRAIGSVGEAKAFDRTVEVVQQVVDRQLARAAGTADGTVRVEVRDLVDSVLATLCRDWFGIPDGQYVVEGGWHWVQDQATCPGHFGAPSRYTFQPNPGDEVERVGQAHGQMLLEKVKAWLMGRDLTEPQPWPIVEAIVRSTAGAKAEACASTLIGIMMGFLPTVDGNLRSVLAAWVDDRSLWEHQGDLLARLAGRRLDLMHAEAAIGQRLTRALHQHPVPELVWRTATESHTIGTVEVQPGDRIVVGLVGALQQQLSVDEPNLAFLFGGHRNGQRSDKKQPDAPRPMQPIAPGNAGEPTHACPGFGMAWGVMLGFIAGLMSSARLHPTLSPVSLKLSPLVVGGDGAQQPPPAPGGAAAASAPAGPGPAAAGD